MATTSLSLDHTAVLLSQFYKKSDDPEDHDGYADFFTDEASLIMGLKHYKGREGRLHRRKLMSEILQFRKTTWAAVASRHHVLTDTYPKSHNDIMLMGTVQYELKNGKSLKSEWAGRMYLVDGKISFYQVYIDASPLLIAQGKTIRGDENGELVVE